MSVALEDQGEIVPRRGRDEDHPAAEAAGRGRVRAVVEEAVEGPALLVARGPAPSRRSASAASRRPRAPAGPTRSEAFSLSRRKLREGRAAGQLEDRHDGAILSRAR